MKFIPGINFILKNCAALVEKCTQNHPEHTLGLSHPGGKLKPVLVTIFKMKSSRERGTFLVQRAQRHSVKKTLSSAVSEGVPIY